MEIELGPDETMLRDAAARYVERKYDFESRKRRMREPGGFCRSTWREMADTGLVGAGLPAEAGGLGAGALGTMIVAEALGGVLAVEPYLATAVLGAAALELGGGAAQRGLLGKVAEGGVLLAFAHHEEPGSVATTATVEEGGYRLDGMKFVVLHAAAADFIVVTACLDGGAGGRPPALFVVPAGAPGMAMTRYRTPDGFPAADVSLEGVRVDAAARLAAADDSLLERVLDRGRVAICAEAVGAMDAVLRRTISYLGTRQQFGQPLASFQALRHRVAEMAMEVEQARSLAFVAAGHAAAEQAAARARHVAAAAVGVARAARFVGQQAVQLHGGIGMTADLDVSHYFRRLTAIVHALGEESEQLDRYLAASGR